MDEKVATLIIVAMVGTFALISQVLRQYFRRRDPGVPTRRDDVRLEEIGRRLETLQQSVDATAIEVERLGEGLRFTTKVLTERGVAREPQRQPERVITPH